MANYSYKTQWLLHGAQNCAGASTKAETGRETVVSLCSHFGVPDLTRDGGYIKGNTQHTTVISSNDSCDPSTF